MGQSKISLTELSNVKRKSTESIDQYFNRFRLLKAWCFTQVSEHELVKIDANELEYSIRKKFIDTQSLKYMAQLAIKVRSIEHLKDEKTKPNKYHKKGRVAYVEIDDYLLTNMS